jgi:protein regulator of cytokinesis 1
MKELFIKKKAEIEEICKISHMDMPHRSEIDNIARQIMSGVFQQSYAIPFSFKGRIILSTHRITSPLYLKNICTGDVDHDNLLKTMDGYIFKTKEDATSRKEIMDKVEKWITSCDEERWLEEYSRVQHLPNDHSHIHGLTPSKKESFKYSTNYISFYRMKEGTQ